MQEELNRLKKKGYSNKDFESYVNNPNIKKIYNASQIQELKALWYGDEIIEQEKELLVNLSDNIAIEKEVDLDAMNKDELDEYANTVHGIDLDKRFKKETMIEELEEELKKQNEE